VVWPAAEETLLVDDTATAVVQIDGKVRAKLEVSAKIGADELERLARADERVIRALGGKEITRAIARPPKIVSFSTK
jgi:leucyl-tRNA synthetase